MALLAKLLNLSPIPKQGELRLLKVDPRTAVKSVLVFAKYWNLCSLLKENLC